MDVLKTPKSQQQGYPKLLAKLKHDEKDTHGQYQKRWIAN